MDKLKKILYWASLIGPVVDIVLGAVKGIIAEFSNYDQFYEQYQKDKQLDQFKKDNE